MSTYNQSTIWNAFLNLIKSKIKDELFEIWFKPMNCSFINEHKWIIELPNEHYFQWVSNNYYDIIQDTIFSMVSSKPELIFTIHKEPEQSSLPLFSPINAILQSSTELEIKNSNAAFTTKSVRNIHQEFITTPSLNSEYTFDNFVVGGSNEFAYAASMAIASKPAQAYNPLFIYGGVGLGKTHLMHAIGNEIVKNCGLRVLYLTSEQFTNELINSIEKKTMTQFKERFRTQCDVLLIDDIQFIAGKSSTQEEFFHTFNALHNSNKQIILSSDKPPQEIGQLEERLKSRFIWGLISDIKMPDLETRIAILRKKALREKIELHDDVAQYIASHVTSNIRELEGCLKRIAARAKLSKDRINLKTAISIVEPYVNQRCEKISPNIIIQKVCTYFGVSTHEIYGKTRSKPIIYPRQLAMYLSRKHTSMSYPELGRLFKKDHTSIINAYSKIDEALNSNIDIKEDINAIEKLLKNL